MILAYNLHFVLPSENVVMKVLAEKKTSKVFTERLMYLLNRGGNGNEVALLMLFVYHTSRFDVQTRMCEAKCLQ